jgi:Putative adhesin
MKTRLAWVGLFLSLYGYVNAQDGNFHLDKEYKVNAAGIISLTSSDGKIYITGSTRTTAHVKIDREIVTKGLTFGHEEFSVDVAEENGNLTIKEHSNSVSVGMVGYRTEKYSIHIEAPEGVNLQIKGDDGDLWIKNVKGSISLDMDDADVDLAGCSGDKFSFKMDDGKIKMDTGKGTLDIDADDTDIEIRNANFTKLDANIDDGDLIIETSLADNGEYSIDAQDGLVSMTITKGGGKFNIRHDDGRVTTEGDFKIQEDSDRRTMMTLATGTAKVDIRTDDARVKLMQR